MTYPKISIVTPSFNQGRYIEQTIRSVINQNYPNLEYIIIDGGSTDETAAIIKKYEPWITYWVSEPDMGQSHAINKGLQKCTGDIFTWLNSDDWYTEDTFVKVADIFRNNPHVRIVSGFENHIAIDGSVSQHEGSYPAKSLEETIEMCHISQPSTFFKLNDIKKVGGVSEDLHYMMDGELWIRFLLLFGQEGFYKIKTPLVNFRFHESSKTVTSVLSDNFLFERSSVINDLQRHVGLPGTVRDFWIKEIYGIHTVKNLNRQWPLNKKFITKRSLRLYFTRKYIIKQFIKNDVQQASWGIKQLISDYSFGFFTIRNLIKLLMRKFQKA